MQRPLEIKQKNATVDKVDKYKGLERVLFLLQNLKRLDKEEENIANLRLPLVIKHRKGIEDKVNKY